MISKIMEGHTVDISLSNEEYVNMYTKPLKEQLDILIDNILKDETLNINNEEYFLLSNYKKIIKEIEDGISKQFNINFKLLPNDEFKIDVEYDTKDYIKVIKSYIKSNKVNTDNVLKLIKTSTNNIHGNKFKNKPTIIIGINLNKLIIEEKEDSSYIAKLILDSINSVYDINVNNNNLLDVTNKIVKAVKDGKDINYIATEIVGIDDPDFADKSEINKFFTIINKVTEDHTDGDKDKLHTLVRINYLLVFITCMIVIYTALSVPYLGISIVALLVYNIFLYLYKVGAKVITGNKDPLNEEVNGIKDLKTLLFKDSYYSKLKTWFSSGFNTDNIINEITNRKG